ncbi:hypothetical protein ZYGR_0A05370 [Zygosaccharomyces rouxii]|uniref:ZYRO0A12408p n=2 Tax=Zygosaccharomyces rouxii TaxID=4956 RepID=C5DNX5_ZYGRC|nr:uncharacterized protein ZYRO0A12408g [Zygosaccharomyces rouxii]KAH9198510.1 hypothetical protein LQ764DRAFT_137977 [Zygosaccharomyces rouxii]GAV46939.1 hypothetical protein ZYGR_0A05370 [Zygosaccharomyces rouxii]CAR25966.1 ZYRO0A12408p [Zygosaccharomyces rouxii]
MNGVDLSHVLGKQVTTPALFWMIWMLYRDLRDGKRQTQEAQRKMTESSSREGDEEKEAADDNIGISKWKPLRKIREQVVPVEEEEKEKYTRWDETEPYPYKPFKPGEHRLTMGVTTIPFNYWFVMDKTFKKRIDAKWEILRTDYEDLVYHVDPAMINDDGGESNNVPTDDMYAKIVISPKDVEQADQGLCEVYSNVINYLACKFPQYFHVVLSPGETPGALYNSVLNEYHPVDPNRYLQLANDSPLCINYRCFNTDIIPDKLTKDLHIKEDEIGYRVLISCDRTRRAHELILAMGRLVEDDLLLLSRNERKQYNGEYIMLSGLFGFAAGFNPRNRFLKPLTLVHGPVPEYKRDLQSQMNKFLAHLKPYALANRVNYTFQNHDMLYAQKKFTDSRARSLDELHGGKDVHYRSERQTLTKFSTPNGSDTIVFGVRTYLWNFRDQWLANNFYNQPHIIDELERAISDMNHILGTYKGRDEWGPPLMNIIEQHKKLRMAN